MHCKRLLRQCVLLVLFVCWKQAHAADTLSITMQHAQQLFTQKNMALLAAHYNISMSEAAEIQARLIDNPEVEIEANLFNPENRRPFDILSNTGDYKIGIQQLIPLAGKRKRLMAIAKTHTSLAKFEYMETARGLILTLRSNLYETYFLLKSKEILEYQISVAQRISAAFNKLQERKDITATEALVARSLFYSLLNEKTGIQNRLYELTAELQILLASPETVFLPQIPQSSVPFLSLPAIIDTAMNNRPELRIARNTISLNQLNLGYEKALKTPDLTAGIQYERRGGFVENATSFELGMAIPLFNKNQGNIKAARIAIDQSKMLYEQQKLTVQKEVEASYKKYVQVEQTLENMDAQYFDNHEQMLQKMLENYRKGTITIQELANFYETYKNNVTGFYELQIEKYMALEEINYFAGAQIFK